MPTLNIQLPGFPPVSHVLKDETITIGRMKGNTIVIEDSSISLMHAKITRKDGEYYLKDLNSTNGTILNGQPLGEARLHDLDRVRFAGISAQFVAENPEQTPVQFAQSLPVSPQPPLPGVPLPLPATPSAVPAIPGAAPLLKIAAPGVPAQGATQSNSATTTVLATRKRSNINLARVFAVASVTVTVVLGLGGWVFWQGRHETRDKFASRSPAPQSVAKSRGGDPQSQPSMPKSTAAPVKPVLETDNSLAPSIAQWAKALKSSDPAERRQAATSLHSAGTEAKAAIPDLREALKDSDPDVQLWSALALVNNQSHDKAVVPILVRSLQNSNSVVRQVACLSLGLIPYEAPDKDTVVPPLAETAAKDVDEEVRHAAKSALSIIAPELSNTAANK